MNRLEAHIIVLEEIRKDIDRVLQQVPETALAEGWSEDDIERTTMELQARKASLGVAIDHLRRVQ